MSDGLVLLAPILLPFLGATIALLVRQRPALAAALGVATHSLLAAASIALFWRVIDGVQTQLLVFGDWPRGFGVPHPITARGVVSLWREGEGLHFGTGRAVSAVNKSGQPTSKRLACAFRVTGNACGRAALMRWQWCAATARPLARPTTSGAGLKRSRQ